MTDSDMALLAEKCRRDLDDMNYYEGTLQRDGCIYRHIRDAVDRALAEEREGFLARLEQKVCQAAQDGARSFFDQPLGGTVTASGRAVEQETAVPSLVLCGSVRRIGPTVVWYCIRPKGHKGRHEASDNAWWENDKENPDV